MKKAAKAAGSKAARKPANEAVAPARRRPAPPLPPASAYFIEEVHDRTESHTLSIIVDNEPGVLARVIGLFSGRGYNIDSLTVSETEHAKHVSRITIVTTGTPMVLAQIRNQLERMVPIHSVTDLTVGGRPLERELALVKVAGHGQDRVEALRLADAFRAVVIDATVDHFVFEVTGKTSKIEQFVAIMAPLGLVEVCRTGIAAISRGAGGRAEAQAGFPMSAELLAAFVVFAAVTLFTPGPNNIMLMTLGLNFGFARTLPHSFGVALGFGFLVLVVGLGLGAVFVAFPAIYTVLKFGGAAYLLYLAWRIANSGPARGDARPRPLTFIEGAAFQWINPKGWVMAVGAVTAYAALATFPLNVALIASIFSGLGILSSWTWLLFGTSLRPIVTDPRRVRVFNGIMAVALAASLVPIFVEG